MLQFAVLASGSKGNCTFVGDSATRVLIDCGLSCRETCRRLAEIGVDPSTVTAIVLTHEHSDHTKGIPIFSKRFGAKLYANQRTLAAFGQPDVSAVPITTGSTFRIGSLSFEAFSIPHDAAEPIGLRVLNSAAALAVATDLGQVTTLVRDRLRHIDALILEANHDIDMLNTCSYPWPLKQRIKGTYGHLSNAAAGALLGDLSRECGSRLRWALAAHISENSNTPNLALTEFEEAWTRGGNGHRPSMLAAAQKTSTALFTVES